MKNIVRSAVVLTAVGASMAALAASTVHTVEQSGKVFSLTELTVTAGDQITILNKDAVTHSLFARTPDYDIRATQAPGAESTFTFDKPGVVELRCAIHPQMVLKVKVNP